MSASDGIVPRGFDVIAHSSILDILDRFSSWYQLGEAYILWHMTVDTHESETAYAGDAMHYLLNTYTNLQSNSLAYSLVREKVGNLITR